MQKKGKKRKKKSPISKIIAEVKVNISTICLEKSGILLIFEEIMSNIHKNLYFNCIIRYFNSQLQKKVRVLLISRETMHLWSQLGGRKKLSISIVN